MLEQWIDCMMSNKWLQIQLVGHCGIDVYDAVSFSYRRARAVHEYLLHRGVCRSRMQVTARGNKEPLSRRLGLVAVENRRVEIFGRASDGRCFPHIFPKEYECNWPPAGQRRQVTIRQRAARTCSSRLLTKIAKWWQSINNMLATSSVSALGMHAKST